MSDVVPIKDRRGYERKVRQSAAGVLRDCRALHPTAVLVMGYADDGRFFVRAAPPDPGQALLLMELAKNRLLGVG